MTLVKAALAAIVFGCCIATAAAKDSYPTRPIRLIVPFPAGSIADLTGRVIAKQVSIDLKQTIIVLNRPGATGSLGAEYVSKAEPDGYTLLVGNDATNATNQLLYKSVTYDPLKDFTPIAPAIESALVLVVNPSVPAHSVQDLVGLARSGAKLSFGSSGIGSPHHLAGEMLNMAAHIHMMHVPYKGGAPAVVDLLSGQIPVLFTSVGSIKPNLDTGKARAIAVLTKKRYPGLPDVPTVAETYPGLEMSGWTGFFGPRGMSPAIVAKLNASIQKALADPKVVSVLTSSGLTPIPGPASALRDLVAKEVERRAKIIQAAGIKPE